MPIPMKVSADGGTLISVPTSAFVILQGTNSSSKPTRIKRFTMGSNNTGSSQQAVQISFGYYATGTSTGGSVPVSTPVDEGLTGVYTGSTVFRAGTATMGTTFTQKQSWQWLTCNPFDLLEGMLEVQDELPASKCWAFIMPTGPGVAFTLAATLYFEEFG